MFKIGLQLFFETPEDQPIKAEINIAPIKISTKKPQIASSTCLISNSFGLDLGITCGVISATGRKNTGFNQIENFIQTDAAANPGSVSYTHLTLPTKRIV